MASNIVYKNNSTMKTRDQFFLVVDNKIEQRLISICTNYNMYIYIFGGAAASHHESQPSYTYVMHHIEN